jgi:hypothetical protein
MNDKQHTMRIVDRELPLKLMILGSSIDQYLKNHQLNEEDIPGLYSREFDIFHMRVMMANLQDEYEEGLLTRDQYLVQYDGLNSIIEIVLHYKVESSKFMLERLSPVKSVRKDQKLVLMFIDIAKQVVTDMGIPRDFIVLETIERMREEIRRREKNADE